MQMQYRPIGTPILSSSARYVVARSHRHRRPPLPIATHFNLTCPPLFVPRRQKSTDSSLSSPELSPKIKYNWIRGVEELENYTTGGYHPVNIGDKLHDRYYIVDKLGFGGYSTVWLARDLTVNRYVALKIGVAGSHAPLHEMKILEALSQPSSSFSAGRRSLPFILDKFEVEGPNGIHPCYTMTPARGDLREAREIDIFPLNIARAICGGLALAVAYLHSRGYVHGDIHLRNMLAMLPSSLDELSIDEFHEEYGKPQIVPVTRTDKEPLPPNTPGSAVLPLYLGISAEEFKLSDARILLSDFGEAFSPSEESRLGKDCHTPLPMRPPEARLDPELPLSYSADIWSLATALWDIVCMKGLFSHDFATEDEMVSQNVDIIGPLPSPWRERWSEKEAEFFDEQGQRRNPGEMLWPSLEVAFEHGVQKWRRKLGAGVLDDEEKEAFLSLMRRMLVFRPEERISAEEVLKSEWMVKWVMPDFERSLREDGDKEAQK